MAKEKDMHRPVPVAGELIPRYYKWTISWWMLREVGEKRGITAVPPGFIEATISEAGKFREQVKNRLPDEVPHQLELSGISKNILQNPEGEKDI